MSRGYTRAERTAYIDAFKSSGLTQTDFCKEHNINYKSFNNWLRLHKQSDLGGSAQSKSAPDPQSKFIPVQVSDFAVAKDNIFQQSPATADAKFLSIPIKTKGFCVEVPVELLASKNAPKVRILLNILHQLPINTCS